MTTLPPRWRIPLALTLALWISVPFMRPISEWLRALGGIRPLMLAGLLVVAFAATRSLCSRSLNVRHWVALIFIAIVYVLLFVFAVVAPEERFHFLIMPALTYAYRTALTAQNGREWIAALAATGAGLVEELLQAVTPERFFDLRDIGMSAAAAFLTAAALRIGRPS